MAFAVGVGLNGALVACQVGFGLAAGSVALLADATHNLGDVLGLALAWAASVMAGRAPSAGRTYGWGRFSILASLANAVLLLVSIGAIGLGAVQRLIAPAPIDTGTVAWVAGAGIVVNGVTALLFMRGRGGDMNLRAAFTHMVADALLSAGVLAAALVIARTGWLRLDPVMSLILVGVIAAGTWALLRESVNLAMDAVPRGLDEQEIADHLGTLPGVKEVHDLHVWALSTTLNAATVHLVADGEGDAGSLTGAATCTLREKFGIGHVTVQVETLEGAADCLLRPAEVI
jgi:cobalt-zinc-cadmium efflux system protein